MLRLVSCALGGLAVASAADGLVMPKEYSTVMKLSMPYIGLEMPLRVLTSSKAQKIEYYDGLQVDFSNPNGTTKYVFQNGRRACMFTPNTAGPKLQSTLGDDDWSPTMFFPSDLSKYTLAGEGLVGGIMCQKYTLYAKHGSMGTMDDHVTFYWDAVLKKPVRWHMHNRPEPFGSHTDEYILDVLSYQVGAPNDAELAVPASCAKETKSADVSIQIGGLFTAMHAVSASKSSAELPLFDMFLRQHGKSYSPAEYGVRQGIFENNVKRVNDLNRRHAGKTTFKGNQFLDMTKEEVLSFRGGKSKSAPRDQRRTQEDQNLVSIHSSSSTPSKNFDWRTARPGVVGPVKDQAMCGSCWAYGAIGPIESFLAIQSGKPYQELPEQYMVDCTWTNCTGDAGCNQGCDGGNSDQGTLEIVKNHGGIIPTAAAYGSYLSINGYCKDTKLMEVGAKVTGWVDIKDRDEQGVLDALFSKGPVSVGIMVPDDMLYYDSGVLQVESCKHNSSQIDHAVVATGYGTDAHGTEYWTIRNSWSTYWGDQGYINIARGENDCCVACEAGYPNVGVASASIVV